MIHGCQKYIENYLSELGFKTEYIKYGDVQNMISTLGTGSPCLIFVGHTDVVPSGRFEHSGNIAHTNLQKTMIF